MGRAASPYITQEQAAERLGVSLTSFRLHVQPKVPKYRIGRRVLFKLEELDAVMTEEAHRTIKKKPRVGAMLKTSRKVAELARDLEAS